MCIFLDTGNINEIKRFQELGIIRGVTTNPSILVKDGVNKDELLSKTKELAAATLPFPLSVEVLSNNIEEMESQAVLFHSLAPNINVKIPIHGPDGELKYLSLISKLAKSGLTINATAMMSAQQCLLAAMAGATYVSLFGGRVANMGYSPIEEIAKLRKLLESQRMVTKIIIGSVRESLNVTEWLLAGAHIVTVSPKLLEGMIVHPYTKETVRMFLDDAAKL
jgi:transaldolase